MANIEETEEIVPSTPEEQEQDASDEDKPTSKRKTEDSAAVDPEGEGEEGSGEDEEEYEIEAILDVKKGYFGNGKIGYLVSWKGYGPDQNSWVNEDDAQNASELIDEFWARKHEEDAKKKRMLRKSDMSSKAESAKSRKGVDKEKSPRSASASANASSKRGRGRKAASDDEGGSGAEEVEEDSRKKKRRTADKDGANGTTKGGRKSLSALAKEADQDGDVEMSNGVTPTASVFTNMKSLKHHNNLKSWEDIVKSVSTVERVGDELVVYFETTSGEFVREQSALCAKKFPQKLIQFYESHLRWRIAEGNVEE